VWVLGNKGRNEYLPFGSITTARTLEEWRLEQRLRADRQAAHHSREQEQRVAKLKRAEQSAARTAKRKQASRQRHAQFDVEIAKLRGLNAAQRLLFLASESGLPLEVVPSDLIGECFSAVGSLDDNVRETLLKRIDRRHGRIWKQLRAALKK
jgi:hypothetical protein